MKHRHYKFLVIEYDPSFNEIESYIICSEYSQPSDIFYRSFFHRVSIITPESWIPYSFQRFDSKRNIFRIQPTRLFVIPAYV